MTIPTMSPIMAENNLKTQESFVYGQFLYSKTEYGFPQAENINTGEIFYPDCGEEGPVTVFTGWFVDHSHLGPDPLGDWHGRNV